MDARVWDPKLFRSSSVMESGEAKPGSVGTKQGPDHRSVVSLCFPLSLGCWAFGVNKPVLKLLIF